MTDEPAPGEGVSPQMTHAATSLPRPTAEESARSARLVELIRDEIAVAGGNIDFSRYMELALYSPGLGYYRGGAQKFGASGDFVTAPELSTIFARCLARPCKAILAGLGHGDILEAGVGSGALALGLLRELEQLGALPEHYFILELSAELQQHQRALIEREAPELFSRVQWLQTLPEDKLDGIVLANEVLDAMPVHRFRVEDDGIHQLYVGWSGERFTWDSQPASPEVGGRIAPLALPPGYTSEINFQAEAWVKSLAERMNTGALLIIDYGFPQREFYHLQRSEGTLMCHYRHRNHADPLILTGLQDITAHVDFTAMAEAGCDSGLSLLGYTSQAAFLLASGLTELIAESDPRAVREHLALTHEINKLTSPAEMGELYKVMALGRGIDTPLPGFSLQDRRGRL
ncbi:MAG: SAM-dependent methyltransferase [Acidiferrobacterales bacterium]